MKQIIIILAAFLSLSCSTASTKNNADFKIESNFLSPVNIVLANSQQAYNDVERTLQQLLRGMLEESNIFSDINFGNMYKYPYGLRIEYKREQPKDKDKTERAAEFTSLLLWSGSLFLIPMKERLTHSYHVDLYKKENLSLITSLNYEYTINNITSAADTYTLNILEAERASMNMFMRDLYQDLSKLDELKAQ